MFYQTIRMSSKWSVVLIDVSILIALSVAKQVTPDDVSASASVLGRLAKVEVVVKQLQDENKKLGLENKVLAERLDEVERVCRARGLQFLAYKKRLKSAEIEIFNLKSKSRDRKAGNEIVQESNLRDSKDHNRNELCCEKQIPDAVQFSKPLKKPNVIRSDDVTKAPMSKRLLLQISTTATTPNYKAPRIAFSAHTSAQLKHVGDGQKLIFSNVNDNEGGGYDPLTGVFICPLAGTYHLEATITSVDVVYAEITVNGSTKSKLVCSGDREAGQSSNSLITRLNQGDHVWVKHTTHTGTTVYGDWYSHFAGFILWTH